MKFTNCSPACKRVVLPCGCWFVIVVTIINMRGNENSIVWAKILHFLKAYFKINWSPEKCKWKMPVSQLKIVSIICTHWLIPSKFYCFLVPKWGPTSMDCSPPSSSVHSISQARILEWVTISFSRGSSRPRLQPGSRPSSLVLADGFFTTEPQGKALNSVTYLLNKGAREPLYIHTSLKWW